MENHFSFLSKELKFCFKLNPNQEDILGKTSSKIKGKSWFPEYMPLSFSCPVFLRTVFLPLKQKQETTGSPHINSKALGAIFFKNINNA
jgi:hypothetical protein